MTKFYIVSKKDRLEEYLETAREYQAAFEINDFFEPDMLDDEEKQKEFIAFYREKGIPAHSTMHGAFYDVVIFSQDKKIRDISRHRMEQSMQIARKLGVEGVVFHVNHNPCIHSAAYTENEIQEVTDYLQELLESYPEIHIYLENMFEDTPDILEVISERLKNFPNYGVCLDWAHAGIYGGMPENWAKRLSEHVRHIHVNDNDLIQDLHLPVGRGKVDWENFAKCYEKYLKGCSILVETNEPAGQRESLEYLKRILGM